MTKEELYAEMDSKYQGTLLTDLFIRDRVFEAWEAGYSFAIDKIVKHCKETDGYVGLGWLDEIGEFVEGFKIDQK